MRKKKENERHEESKINRKTEKHNNTMGKKENTQQIKKEHNINTMIRNITHIITTINENKETKYMKDNKYMKVKKNITMRTIRKRRKCITKRNMRTIIMRKT